MENVLLRITHDEADKPHCCEEPMRTLITSPPLVHWADPNIEPFRAVATPDRPVITTTRQNREYMKRNNLVDVSDLPPPTREQEFKTLKEVDESIAKISPTEEVSAKMREQGIDSII
jgi:hypothetical protein